MNAEIFMDVAKVLADMGESHGSQTFKGRWSEKNWMNTPGTIYCGQTDNCWTGPGYAPDNVLLDTGNFEVIYKQPVSRVELEWIVDAANADPMRGYCADGNVRWSYQEIKDWWANRQNLLSEVTRIYERTVESHQEWLNSTPATVGFRNADVGKYAQFMRNEPKYENVEDPFLLYIEFQRREVAFYVVAYSQWMNYIQQGLYRYLQFYAFFLDNGRIADDKDNLPKF